MALRLHSGRGLQIGAWGRGSLGAEQSQACLVNGFLEHRQHRESTRTSPPPLQVDRAGDNHTVGTPGGLCLIAENGDVALGDALRLEFNRHITAAFMEDVKAPV